MTDVSKDKLPAGLDYQAAVDMTGLELKCHLRKAPAVIRHMTSHLAKAAGKMIRAKALLACAIRSDGLIEPDAVKAAVAIELLHLATLVHDDIIDNAGKRRGIEALHAKFGSKYAVLCGDYLLCMALEFASDVGALEKRRESIGPVFPGYLSEVCLGEIRQNQNNGNYRLSEREYFKIIRGKTAALFEACFYVGFLLSDEEDGLKDLYAEIGNNIGIIFQLSDDCADYASTQKLAKKPVLSDYSLGVVTLPLIYALKMDKNLAERAMAGMEPSELKAAVAAAGGIEYAGQKIEGLIDKTNRLLKSLDIPPRKRTLLSTLLRKAAGQAI